MSHTLVLGGQRSGKSRHAEQLVLASGKPSVYIATATAGDGEMAERIRQHRDRRGVAWQTVEEPLDLPGALLRAAGPGTAVLVDCLTLWLTNLIAADRSLDTDMEGLTAALAEVKGQVVIVTNEVGSGIIPDNALARRFADALGTLNQRVAAAVDRVVLVAAGIPLVVKSPEREREML